MASFAGRKIIVLTIVGTAFALTMQATGALDYLVALSRKVY